MNISNEWKRPSSKTTWGEKTIVLGWDGVTSLSFLLYLSETGFSKESHTCMWIIIVSNLVFTSSPVHFKCTDARNTHVYTQITSRHADFSVDTEISFVPSLLLCLSDSTVRPLCKKFKGHKDLHKIRKQTVISRIVLGQNTSRNCVVNLDVIYSGYFMK